MSNQAQNQLFPPVLPPGALPPDKIPPVPRNPPTHDDYFLAVILQENIQNRLDWLGGTGPGALQPAHLVAATEYAHTVLAAIRAAAGPAGLVGDQVHLPGDPMVTRQELGAQLYALAEELRAVRVLAQRVRPSSRSINMHGAAPYEIIPFTNGRLPMDPPAALPALRTASDLLALSSVELERYLNGYGLAWPPTIEEGRAALGRHLGVR
ncbi:hypothetical protein FA95DRAFT_1611034 [Auriscalpium vulgare]|uniref:Uncharacterized protein n=1 Tax=Auriscalpium vulgare TaxID=40419 RepID=A0ACB8RB94_9AGAM|nr:hypothetical protein FA95DRAFT_1611034 [Auriscalpium vulgare]